MRFETESIISNLFVSSGLCFDSAIKITLTLVNIIGNQILGIKKLNDASLNGAQPFFSWYCKIETFSGR